MNFQIRVKGLTQYEDYLKEQPKAANKAALLAINDTLRRTRVNAKKAILRQVNLKPSYINDERLSVVLAKPDNLTGYIIGRRRPTSLARFDANQLYSPNKTKPGRKASGVTVKVKNTRRKLPTAFLKNLKSGNRDSGNVGLAIRLPHGQQPKRKFRARPLYSGKTSDVYLLYGPSVQQVFDDVAEELKPEISTYMESEFRRQYLRLTNG